MFTFLNRITKCNIILLHYVNSYKRICSPRRRNAIITLGFLWYFKKKEKNHVNNINVYDSVLIKADQLFESEKYLETYNLLSSQKINDNADINWRLCRSLYKMTRTDNFDEKTKKTMILEAYNIIEKTLESNKNSPEVYKWMAILLDTKLQNESKFYKLEDKMKVKDYLMEAYKLNPNDFAVSYMLGQWHYKLCTLSWFQKQISKLLYPEVPTCNYEDALKYFLRAEEIKPKSYLSNTYMIGKVNYQLGNMFRAHYYLTIATEMTPISEQDKEYINTAKNLIKKIKKYDLSEEAL